MLLIHAFFSIINFAVLGPTCIYMEKNGPRKEGHCPSRVDFLPRLDQVYPAEQAKVAQRLTLP